MKHKFVGFEFKFDKDGVCSLIKFRNKDDVISKLEISLVITFIIFRSNDIVAFQ